MFRPSSLQDLETRADMVVSDVFSEVEGLLKEPMHVPTSAGVGAEQVRPTRRRATEFVLITGSVFAVGITAVLWWGQLHPPTTAPATVIATGPPAPTTLEQTVLNNYKSETERLANQLRKLPAQPRKDPWLSPRPVALLAPWAGIAALPRLQPPLQNLPALQPLRLPPAPPGTTIQTSTIQIPTSPALTAVPLMVPLPPAPPLAPPLPPTEPVLAGVVEAGGTNPMAIIRIGEQLHNYTPGKEVKDGWLVSQIQSDRVILKRNGQTRSLQLGENP
ncbi:MAG: hypothetical protein H7Y22_04480 [Gemmatimonadaceae bacterium]|nr:hypothetical protein [Gloeobacterales cyanobacterium ES-bin-141]